MKSLVKTFKPFKSFRQKDNFTQRVPARYRDRGPRLVKLLNGGDGVIME